jgi:hypothetical protein
LQRIGRSRRAQGVRADLEAEAPRILPHDLVGVTSIFGSSRTPRRDNQLIALRSAQHQLSI